MCDGILLMSFSIYTHKRSLQNIRQELRNLSLVFLLVQAQHVKVSVRVSFFPHDGLPTLLVLYVD